jgi:hypothetical protein
MPEQDSAIRIRDSGRPQEEYVLDAALNPESRMLNPEKRSIIWSQKQLSQRN